MPAASTGLPAVSLESPSETRSLYENTNRLQEALKFYKKAVKTKPGDYVARLRYSFLLLRQGQENLARQVIEEAFSISKFNQDGLALNAVYRHSGTSPQDFEKQIEKFAHNLAQVPAAKPVQLEVGLEFVPPQQDVKPSMRAGKSFEQAYQTLRGNMAAPTQEVRAFKRMFTLPAASAEERAKQIQDFTTAVRQRVSQVQDGYQVNLSLQGRTADYAAPGALTQNRTTAPKAVYDPRIVGNDMGLWVMGRTWLKFVTEAEEELEEYTCPPNNMCSLLKGLAALAKGNAVQATQYFNQAAQQNPQDPLAQLGLGTAAVIVDDDAQARQFYEQALTLAPSNKTAKRNLKILTDK